MPRFSCRSVELPPAAAFSRRRSTRASIRSPVNPSPRKSSSPLRVRMDFSMFRAHARTAVFAFYGALLVSCKYDNAYRQDPVGNVSNCALGDIRCDGSRLEQCEIGVDGRPGWALRDDCGGRGLACGVATLGCTTCAPGSTACGGDLGNRVDTCRADGSGYDPGAIC